MGLLILPIMLLALYWFMIRPQQQRMKEQQALLRALEVGDDVLTSAGIYGTVSELDGNTVFILVADGVEIKVTKESITQKVTYAESPAE
jgi:preprotein translocase subunit YajC